MWQLDREAMLVTDLPHALSTTQAKSNQFEQPTAWWSLSVEGLFSTGPTPSFLFCFSWLACCMTLVDMFLQSKDQKAISPPLLINISFRLFIKIELFSNFRSYLYLWISSFSFTYTRSCDLVCRPASSSCGGPQALVFSQGISDSFMAKKHLSLKNLGMMSCSFYLECSNPGLVGGCYCYLLTCTIS